MHEIKLRYFDFRHFRANHTHSWGVNPQGQVFLDPNDLAGRAICDYAIAVEDNIHSDPTNPLGKRIISESGQPPVEEASHIVYRESHTNADFHKRCQNGEIIVAPYVTLFGTAVGLNSYQTVYDDEVYGGLGAAFNTDNVFNTEQFWKGHSPFPFKLASYPVAEAPWEQVRSVFYNVNGTWSSMTANITRFPERERLTRSFGSFGELTGIDLGYLLNKIKNRTLEFDLDDDLIQSVLVKANSGDVDVLTAIAELPELLQSIVDGGLLLKKIFNDWKKGLFKLHSRADVLSKTIARRKYNAFIAKKRKGFPSYKRWAKKRRALKTDDTIGKWHQERQDYLDNLVAYEQYWARKEAYFRRQAKHELADAFASVHLNARYNIATTIYTLQDIGDAILNYGTEFKRYRDKRVEQAMDFEEVVEGPCTFTGTNTRTHRAFIKRQYAVGNDLEKLGRSLMADVVVTGFELWRLWSIVFDWFFTIGDALRAINWNPQHLQEASCYSVKTEVMGKLTVPVTVEGQVIDCSVNIDYSGYKRNLIIPSASIGIRWKPKFDLIRQIDALAFFWSVNRGTLKTYYSR